jgi:hypothetical protein
MGSCCFRVVNSSIRLSLFIQELIFRVINRSKPSSLIDNVCLAWSHEDLQSLETTGFAHGVRNV